MMQHVLDMPAAVLRVFGTSRCHPYNLIFDEIMAVADMMPPLYAEDVYAWLVTREEVVEAMNQLTPKQMYELDILFFKQGGPFLMDAFDRPYVTSLFTMQGQVWRVTQTALFTFQAEPVDAYGHEFV